MNPFKIAGLAAILIAVLGAFIDIPRGDLLLVLLGLVVGYAVASEDHVRVLVTALVLSMLSGVFLAVPAIGSYLTSIYGDLGTFVAAGALMIVTRNIWRRFKP